MTVDPRSEREGQDFPAMLRAQRDAAGLTQSELADRAGVAVRTVRDIERGRTGKVQQATAVLLADALNLAGPRRREFLAAAWGRGAGRRDSPGNVTGGSTGGTGARGGERAAAARGVSPPPVLSGRDGDIARLLDLLLGDRGSPAPAIRGLAAGPAHRSGPPVLSLVGVGGVGKSALARVVAHRAADWFPGGAAEIPVVPGTVAAELAADPGTVVAELAAAPGLLLLDAVDRAPTEVRAAVAMIPATLPVLATGRAPLGLPQERVWPVGPLELPPARVDGDPAEVARYPAVAMMLDRLAQVRPEPLAADEVPALVGLVRRLGGLPLALERAAEHARLLGLSQLLARYGDRVLDLDRDLREAVTSSYQLLEVAEQQALRRLAVFRGRWSVELAEQLLGSDPGRLVVEDPVPLLDRLVTLGLVTVRGVRENRFQLLELVRDLAVEQARQHRELAPARRAHALVIARLASRAAPELAGPGLPAAAARLDDLAADVWAALNHTANQDPSTALWLASNLVRWWRLRGRDVAGRKWLRRLLDDQRSVAAGPLVRAWARLGLAKLAHEHGQGGAERAEAEAALAEFRQLGEVAGELAATTVLSAVAWADGRYEQARSYTEATLLVATRAGLGREAMVAQHDLFRHEVRVGDLAAARRRLAAVDRLAAQAGEQRVRAVAAASLAEVARLAGRYDEAVAIGRRVLARTGDGDPVDSSHRRQVLGTVGRALASLGRVAEAERLLAMLRAERQTDPAVCAVIEGRLAWARTDQVAALEWFAAAASAFRDHRDRRGELEAMVCLAASTTDPVARHRLRVELAELVATGGFTLLPTEQALLAAVSPPSPD